MLDIGSWREWVEYFDYIEQIEVGDYVNKFGFGLDRMRHMGPPP